MNEPTGKDDPAVEALRKKLRGEELTPTEAALLAARVHKPDGSTVPHAEVMAELDRRTR